MKVLLVDDNPDMVDVTAYALRRKGFNVILAGDGPHALRRWQADQPDVVLLDVGLPGMSGFEVCYQMRQQSATPVILLTAAATDEDIIEGFRMGADDYVTKPFSHQQLIMRIEAVYRRGATLERRQPARQVQIGDLWIDAESHEVRRGDVEVQLTPREFQILYLLASNVGRVVSTSHLVDYAWGYEGGDSSLLKTHISHIRTKLRLPAKGPGGITVIPTVGYRLTVATDTAAQGKTDSDTAIDKSHHGDTSSIPLRVAAEDETAAIPLVPRRDDDNRSPDTRAYWQWKQPVTSRVS